MINLHTTLGLKIRYLDISPLFLVTDISLIAQYPGACGKAQNSETIQFFTFMAFTETDRPIVLNNEPELGTRLTTS